MEKFKAKEVGKSIIEHLVHIGYKHKCDISELSDSPYIIVDNDTIEPCSSVGIFRGSDYPEYNQTKLLKLKPKLEVKKEDKIFLLGSKLVDYLNSNLVKNSDNYEQIFCIQDPNNDMLTNKWEVLPISPTACGSISSDKMKLIMDWLDKNRGYINFKFSYTDYNESKKRYGTSRPCICLF